LPTQTVVRPHSSWVEFILGLPDGGFRARNCPYPYLVFSALVRNWGLRHWFLSILLIISRCLRDSELISPSYRVLMDIIIAWAWLVLSFKLLFIFFVECLLSFKSTHALHVVRDWGYWTSKSSSLGACCLSTIRSLSIKSLYVFHFQIVFLLLDFLVIMLEISQIKCWFSCSSKRFELNEVILTNTWSFGFEKIFVKPLGFTHRSHLGSLSLNLLRIDICHVSIWSQCLKLGFWFNIWA